MTIYLVAGEASGDSHGAALMQALRDLQPDIRLAGRGGPRMKAVAGAEFMDWIELAGVVGLWEVVRQYPYFRREFHKVLEEIAGAKPAAVVLIDYPGFNLRLARRLRRRSLGGKIIFYISPQVWAWNRGRIPKMARWLDLMLCILPFEPQLYEQSGLRAIFVGHPMIENLKSLRIETERDPGLIGIFPGSRAREVRKIFPIMLGVMQELQRQRPGLRFEIAAASETLAAEIERGLADKRASLGEVKIVIGDAARTMQKSAAGVVASGSATLEAAYFRLPFVLVYKVAGMTYLAGKLLIRVKHLGMPNVLANREIVPEFIQQNARPPAIARALGRLLDDRPRRDQMIADFDGVIAKLGAGGANRAAAEAILNAVSPAPNA